MNDAVSGQVTIPYHSGADAIETIKQATEILDPAILSLPESGVLLKFCVRWRKDTKKRLIDKVL